MVGVIIVQSTNKETRRAEYFTHHANHQDRQTKYLLISEFPQPTELRHENWDILSIISMTINQARRIWTNKFGELLGADNVPATKQSTTKP